MFSVVSRIIRGISLVAMVGAMVGGLSSCGTSRGVTAQAVDSQRDRVKFSGKTEPGKVSTDVAGDKSAGKKGTPTETKRLARIDFKKLKLAPAGEKLLREADSWIGTNYRYGGNDRSGVDCSGFVVQVFRNSLGIDLPRTSILQQIYCDSIAKSEMLPGDLVFFTTSGSPSVGHVGIYIGDNQMVHASSSKGVIISPLDMDYYVRNYFSSGRVGRYYAMIDKLSPGDIVTGKAALEDMAVMTTVVAKPGRGDADAAMAEWPEIEEVPDNMMTEAERIAIRARVRSRVSRIGHFGQ